jgi:peptidoglycan/xylan/chitin deacetylase (PgdA/CDA1 family)
VYLTFDDGPLAGTDDCISVLNQQEIVGSFLMVGNAMFSDWRRAQVASANNSGHLVGNHSYSHWHASSNYGSSGKTNQEWFSDFRQCDAEIAGILNHPASTQYVYSRLPGKNAWRLSGISVDDGNSARVADHLSANGSQIFGWDLEWQYSGTPGASDPVQSPQAMANAVIAALQNPGQTRLAHKVILLTHDHQFRNSRNNDVKLDEFIQILKDSDLDIVFRRLDTYLTD